MTTAPETDAMEANNLAPLHSCSDCAYKTTSLRKLGRHRSVNHAGVKYRCEHCDFITGYQSNYYRHRKQVHNGGVSQSTHPVSTPIQTTPSHHQSQQISGNRRGAAGSFGTAAVPASVASSPFAMSEEYQRLLTAAIMASTAVPLRCDRCPFQATSLEQLAIHVSLSHDVDGQRNNCVDCGITLANKAQWQEHTRTCRRQRTEWTSPKIDYANFFAPFANGNAAAITAAQLLMAAATANGSGAGTGYDLNLLASAATLASSNGQTQGGQQNRGRNEEQVKNQQGINADVKSENQCQRYYACVYDCDFGAVSSREYLHHLRDIHGEQFQIFYCDQCDEYATKFVAGLKRHKALAHDGDKSDAGSMNEDTKMGQAMEMQNGQAGLETDEGLSGNELDESGEERKLSIVLDQGHAEDDDDWNVKSNGHRADGKCQHCSLCSFSTVYGWNLDSHERCHKQSGRYTCRRCGFSQNTRESIIFHLENHHGDIESSSVAVQTENEDENWTPAVDVGFEEFVLEKHAVRVNRTVEVKTEENGGNEEMEMDETASTNSPLDLAKSVDSVRNSTPTPPALMNGVAAILQQNRRHQALHSRVYFKRKQQEQQVVRQYVAPARTARNFRPGLVANRRQYNKRFLSEQEAIEVPLDSLGNEFDNDPDIKNRHCSVCGYQGKWISEMIRHKRVHTNERPFKCKYCSRTSKWKADLIRHVAKVHGYRVVSKYSRSKTFDDADQTALKALKDAVQSSTSPAPSGAGNGANSWTGAAWSPNMDDEMGASFESNEGLDLSMEDRKSNTFQWMMESMSNGDDANEEEPKSEKAMCQNEDKPTQIRQFRGGVVSGNESSLVLDSVSSPTSASSPTVIPPPPLSKEIRDLIGSKQLAASLEKYVTIKQGGAGEAILKCRVCPYETRDLHTFRAHTQKHENKKPYLCSTCGYRSNWSSDVHKHIRLKKSGHESAYVIKLNEADSPGQNGDSTPTMVMPRSSSISDSSSNEYPIVSSGDGHDGSVNSSGQPADGKDVGQLLWRCLKCDFEDPSHSTVTEHLQKLHQASPYACRHCDFTSLHRKICVYHAQCQHDSRDSSIIENLACEYRCVGSKKATENETSDGNDFGLDQETRKKIGNGNGTVGLEQMTAAMMTANALATSAFNGGSAKQSDWMQLAQLCLLGGFPMNTDNPFTSDTKEESPSSSVVRKEYRCEKCPFLGQTESDAAVHEKGHRTPKGLMCYKCVFCDWYAPKKTSIFDHLKLHTDEPGIYKAEVERNMITPLSRKRGAEDSEESAAANALLGLAKVEKKFKSDEADSTSREDESEVGNESKNTMNVNTASSTMANTTRRNGEDGLLGRSDVDDVMSDFNAIINAADQDLAQDTSARDETNGEEIGLTNMDASIAVLRKLWAQDADQDGRGLPEQHNFSITSAKVTQLDLRSIDREAYIHAGEDALDSSKMTDLAKGEIQKVTAVVDGQVRKMWQCRYCPHISKRRANVRMHEKKHFKSSAIGVFKCPKCNYRGDKRSLHVHYRVHMSMENGGSATMPELFQCTNCPAIFQSQDDLALHILNHNNGSPNAFRCSFCSYAVSSSSALQKHIRVHDRQFSTTGESSSNYGVDDGALKRTTTVIRRNPNSAAIANVIVQHKEIDSIGQANETALNLVTRRATPTLSSGPSTSANTPVSPPVALINSASAYVASPLHSLMKPKKYLCTRCPAKFSDRTQLNRHVQFHGVKLKFKCYVCDYSVPFPINLAKHMKSHHNIDMTDVSSAVSLSDNENESERTGSTAEKSDVDDGIVSTEANDPDEDGSSSGSVVASPSDGTLKIKINLGALKPIPSSE